MVFILMLIFPMFVFTPFIYLVTQLDIRFISTYQFHHETMKTVLYLYKQSYTNRQIQKKNLLSYTFCYLYRQFLYIHIPICIICKYILNISQPQAFARLQQFNLCKERDISFNQYKSKVLYTYQTTVSKTVKTKQYINICCLLAAVLS